ncbi:MAG: single-stranded-DNA-specific exonuclease RecJ [Pseudomonadota bacterium]
MALMLSQRFALPAVVGRLLAGRGIGPADAPGFLDPRLRDLMPDPSHLLDVDVAAARLADAVGRHERVGIISDYDVDGATSAALVREWAETAGLEVRLRIPNRLTDGYGPSPALFDALADDGCTVVFVLDSGTTAFDALDHAQRRDLDVIVVDHHPAERALPRACAVVNPNRADQVSPCTGLAAVGVTFLVLVAANRELRRRGAFGDGAEPALMGSLDLVALGTVADVVPLLGLNRAFVRQGLKLLNAAPRPGIAALLEVTGVRLPLTAERIAFALAPRLNAAGRLADATLAADLLGARDLERVTRLAQQLDALNADRRVVEAEVTATAQRQLQAQVEADRRVLLAAGKDWHPGVLGIVAGRMAERFHRPVLVAGVAAEEAVGSARAPDGFDLGAALRATVASGLARRAGGHARAGGFTVDAAKLTAFHDALEANAGTPSTPTLRVDAAVAVGGADGALVAATAALEPYGERHPAPRWRIVGGRIAATRPVGDAHLGLTLAGDDGTRLDGIAFRARGQALGQALTAAAGGAPIQLAGRLQASRYRGHGRAEVIVEDVAAGS